MIFEAFVALREELERAHPGLFVACETRAARALSSLRAEVPVPAEWPEVHRRDLAHTWCSLRGLPGPWSRRSYVCEGVRHALSLLFTVLRESDEPVGLPSDVYPAYEAIAQGRSVRVVPFATWPVFDLAQVFSQCDRAGARWVVLPMPLALHGRAWTRDEAREAERWLLAGPARRLVLDGVYSFGGLVDESVLALMETGQVVYLDSLTQGWLHAQTFGAAVFPAADEERFREAFRSASPPPEKLYTAAHLFEHARGTPASVERSVSLRREALFAKLDELGVAHERPEQGYLVPVHGEVRALARDKGLLCLPASVFGSEAPGRSIASAL